MEARSSFRSWTDFRSAVWRVWFGSESSPGTFSACLSGWRALAAPLMLQNFQPCRTGFKDATFQYKTYLTPVGFYFQGDEKKRSSLRKSHLEEQTSSRDADWIFNYLSDTCVGDTETLLRRSFILKILTWFGCESSQVQVAVLVLMVVVSCWREEIKLISAQFLTRIFCVLMKLYDFIHKKKHKL